MALRYTEEQQKRICEAWQQSSGMSMKQFCHENKVSKSGLYKWLNKYGHKKQVNRDLKMLCACRENSAPETGLEILLPNGVLVRGDNSTISKLILELLK
jgi:transposase-like protein